MICNLFNKQTQKQQDKEPVNSDQILTSVIEALRSGPQRNVRRLDYDIHVNTLNQKVKYIYVV